MPFLFSLSIDRPNGVLRRAVSVLLNMMLAVGAMMCLVFAHIFCWNCTEEAHRPVDCDTVAKWILKNIAESENMNCYSLIGLREHIKKRPPLATLHFYAFMKVVFGKCVLSFLMLIHTSPPQLDL